ncbi:RloB family protein [Lignipirellula cremea]|uniref:RloB-like protein n=1 Tax=Lignipirellula cremea TaxID=2528010 RepID=A0A518E150_9BACT|nr:RloB family protein [Lignipirellula cremea]QDU97818.1 hypothetical protein Pla8534_56750 [Lignipirellula cremea]
MGRRDKPRRPARPIPFKDPKPRILVLSEGEVTEVQYLNGFAEACENPRVDVETIPAAGVPRTIVKECKRRKREAEDEARRKEDDNLRYDEVWAVFDIDEHPHIPDAMQMAEANDIRLAISSPCIELWLYLHLRSQPGPQDRHQMLAKMKECIAGYDKTVNYADYAKGYEDAKRRAAQLEKTPPAKNDPVPNPSTGVWRLTESIQQGS